MKRFLMVILALSVIFSFSGCLQPSKPSEDPVSFFYCTREITFHQPDGVIRSEQRDSSCYDGSIGGMLNIYLQGPESEDLYAPFPPGLRLQSLSRKGSRIVLDLGPALTKLSGVELSLACSCIAMTVMQLREIESVQFISQGETFSGKFSIIIERNNLILTDSNPPQNTQ